MDYARYRSAGKRNREDVRLFEGRAETGGTTEGVFALDRPADALGALLIAFVFCEASDVPACTREE